MEHTLQFLTKVGNISKEIPRIHLKQSCSETDEKLQYFKMYCFIKTVNCGFSLSETETVSDSQTENMELETKEKTEQIEEATVSEVETKTEVQEEKKSDIQSAPKTKVQDKWGIAQSIVVTITRLFILQILQVVKHLQLVLVVIM